MISQPPTTAPVDPAIEGHAAYSGPDRRRSRGRRAQDRATESCVGCPRCGLAIAAPIPSMAVRYCPRCLARSRTLVGMESFGGEAQSKATVGRVRPAGRSAVAGLL